MLATHQGQSPASRSVDFARYRRILDAIANAGVPESWLTPIGLVKVAGAVGLLVGLGPFTAFSVLSVAALALSLL